MTTEDWKSYNEGQNEDGQNRERRPYHSNRSNYGNSQENYGRQDNRGYNRQGSGNYRREGGNYGDRPRTNYNSDTRYDNRQGGYNNYSSENYDRPQRSYDNLSGESQGMGGLRKRRPRVGEVSAARNVNYNERSDTGYNRDDRDNRGGYQQRSSSGRNQRYSQGGNQRGNNNNKFRNNNSRSGGYNPNSKYSFQKQLKYREENFDPNEPIRLNKYLANAGVCSRREADEFIQAGLVKVNGEIVTELGTKVKRADTVMFHDEPIKLEHKIYLLLNKPKNCVTTADDPQERLTVMDLVKTACHERIFPVGRLDRNTTGVLLLTNDGDLSSKLTHPKFLKKKIYHVWLDKDVSVADMQKIAEGIELEDGEIHADAISYVGDEAKDQVGIEIHSGRNRIVRRMFESLGYQFSFCLSVCFPASSRI